VKARIPADIDMADRIVSGLTARQLLIIGAHVLVLWALWLSLGHTMPASLFGAVAVPIAASGSVWVLAKPEGTTPERIAVAAIRDLVTPRRRVFAPEGVPALPRWWRVRTHRVAAGPLGAVTVLNSGVVDLGPEGSALVMKATSVNFALLSDQERQALVDGFGRLLNALDSPAQFLVRSERVDLRETIRAIEDKARTLPHPLLEEAAREHAAFLAELAESRDVLARRVFMCFRDASLRTEDVSGLERRADEAAAVLRGLGIRSERLDPDEVAGLLSRASDPEAPLPLRGTVLPTEVVRASS
jgi:hypothetical protein